MISIMFLLILSVWFFVVYIIARIGVLRLSSPHVKKAALIAAMVVLVPLPVADEIVGGFQFRQLCASQSFKVHRPLSQHGTEVIVLDSAQDISNLAIPVRWTRYVAKYTDSGLVALTFDSYQARGGWFMRTFKITEWPVPLTFSSTCKNDVNYMFKIIDQARLTVNRNRQ